VLIYQGAKERAQIHQEDSAMDELLWYHFLIGAVLIVSSIFIVILVMLQQSRQAGLSGAIAGGSDSFYEKNKGRSKEAKLAFLTKIFAVVFFVTALAAVILFAFLK
jgi:preprotein translocase subunit SecG